MRARQRLMPRKDSVLDIGAETQPVSPGGAVAGARAQTARVRWDGPWAGPGQGLETPAGSRGTHTMLPVTTTRIWGLRDN